MTVPGRVEFTGTNFQPQRVTRLRKGICFAPDGEARFNLRLVPRNADHESMRRTVIRPVDIPIGNKSIDFDRGFLIQSTV